MGGMINSNVDMGDEPMSTINVTSLVDVMFCLLIMFMVASPLSTKKPVDLVLPESKGIELTETELETTMLAIDSTGRVFMGALPLDEDREKWVEQIGANPVLKEAGIAFLIGDETAPFGKVIDVMDALKQAGIHQVGFVTDPNVKKTGEGSR